MKLRKNESFPPKFHSILPKFYISPRWITFIFQRAICKFFGEVKEEGCGDILYLWGL